MFRNTVFTFNNIFWENDEKQNNKKYLLLRKTSFDSSKKNLL